MFFLRQLGLCCALGDTLDAVRSRVLATARAPLPVTDRHSPGRPVPTGLVTQPSALDSAGAALPLRSRTNDLLARALAGLQADVAAERERHGADRIAVVLGSSTAGVAEGEAALWARKAGGDWPACYHYGQQEMISPARFAARRLGLQGPVFGISTACSSGAKALAAGARLLQAGLVDAVVCGGADALCGLTVAGFMALESVSEQPMNPFSRHRRGINLGEAAAVFLMTRDEGPVRLAGWGETSDAHHMSAPDPTGRGAIEAMRLAIGRAGMVPADIDYVNLHGTGTPHNDAMESLAVDAVLGRQTPASSTKPLTGHTLAAAGALEAAFAWLTLVDNPRGLLPPHWWDGEADPALPALHLVQPGETAARRPQRILSTSFAFGGSNAALVLSST
jgi:3-oxoacyl-[acyl-carrier-protein] synthase-1